MAKKHFTPPSTIEDMLELIRSLDRRRGRKPSKAQIAAMQRGRRRARRERAKAAEASRPKRFTGKANGVPIPDRVILWMLPGVAYRAEQIRLGLGMERNGRNGLYKAAYRGWIEAIENAAYAERPWLLGANGRLNLRPLDPKRPRDLWRLTEAGLSRRAEFAKKNPAG